MNIGYYNEIQSKLTIKMRKKLFGFCGTLSPRTSTGTLPLGPSPSPLLALFLFYLDPPLRNVH